MSNKVSIESGRLWLDLSLAQQAIWLDAKFTASSAYQLGGWARIEGPLDEETFRQAAGLIMARHDALRLRVDDELPRQWVDDSIDPPIDLLTLACDGNADDAFHKHVEEVFSEPMPLGDCPLFRIQLIRTTCGLTYLLWRFHHLIADSASISITLGHWLNAYETLLSGVAGGLTSPSSYVKLIGDSASYLESSSYHEDLVYWTERFEPLPPRLISDLEWRANAGAKAAVEEWVISGTALAALRQLAVTSRANLQRLLFGLFSTVLARRYGQTDVVAGVALHRRDAANRRTVGLLAGVIPCRCTFEPHWTLEECIQEFSEKFDADLRHQRMPVDVLSRSLALTGSGRAGLFEAAMSFMPAAEFDDLATLGSAEIKTGVVIAKEPSPISFHVAESASGQTISLRVCVNPDFLPSTEAKTLATLLRETLDSYTRSRGKRFDEIHSVTDAERALVVDQWNQTKAGFPQSTLDQLFREQARRTPDAVAVIGLDGEQLSYAELDARSTALARALAANGVAPEGVVGVRMERSAETIIALLGILKMGGVYLPLDPSYPEERLEYMARDAGAALVLRSIDDVIEVKGDADLPTDRDPNHLAYIIFTSGTTGQPKGVAVAHTPAVNMAFARRACHDPIGVGDRILAAISVGFDVSIGQLLLPLLSGATVVIAGDIKKMGASDLWSLLATRGVTHINSVPSFFDSILNAAPPAGTLRLKRLMLGGEALSGALVARIQRALPGIEVVNMYGPTEACIDATYHVASPEDLQSVVLPIGRPLSNYQAYVLDEALDPVGIGVTGELYLGGVGLARCYVNSPALTAEKFVADPFSAVAGARLYRTGDRARWRVDGRIEFLGRDDQQVKIRGFRVEPEEIGAVLAEHPSVGQAVVVPRRVSQTGSFRLVAYVTPGQNGSAPDAASLRAHVAARLPDYMTPSAFVAIAAIPLNANGKLDFKALPEPELETEQHVDPRTSSEEVVAQLFADVLGVKRCGATSNFFELGGDSLLATSLVSRMRGLGITLPLRTVFEMPTVEALAKRLDEQLGQPEAAENMKIDLAPPPAHPILSFPQERIWFVDRLQQDASYNIPVAFELRGTLDRQAVERAMEQIIARHEALRTRILMRDGNPYPEIVPPGEIRLSVVDLSSNVTTSQDRALRECLLMLARWRFDLAVESPFKLCLIALEPERHVVAGVIHHVAFDGWSAGIFLREFAALYGSNSKLPSLTIQYSDFALWQRRQNQEANLEYWLRKLEGAPARVDLPFRSTPPPPGEDACREFSFRIEPKFHQAAVKLAHDHGATLFMVLHAAFALALSKWSGQDDVVIGTVVANRERSEFEPLIGCFVNTLALRTTFENVESFISLLARVTADDLDAYAHQGLPFEQLVEALQPERSIQHTPVFQVMLVLQNTPLPDIRLAGLLLKPLKVEAQAAQFDLTLNLVENTGGLDGTIEFPPALFETAEMERFANRFTRLLEAAAADPQKDISTICAVQPSEYSLVVEEWNRTAIPVPETTLDQLFREQAARTSDAIAVIAVDGREVTYAELDARSTQLGRQLVANGVGHEHVVGVSMERSAETIIAMLAILKAGGAYLPLDPGYPKERLEYMAADAGALIALRSLDDLSGDAELPSLTDPRRLAYIIYTSGTTGQPKGVAVDHAAAVNLLFARRAGYDPLGPGDRVLGATSVSFDCSFGQLLFPVLSGSTVVIASDIKTIGATGFWSLIARQGVTHVDFVPSFLESVLDAAPRAGKFHIRRFIPGGEALSGSLIGRLRRAFPDAEVVNTYGPTETCIDATSYPTSAEDERLAIAPIGRPMANYQTYVLDERLNPVGVGVTGELYVGGAGLARGYVNSPSLTAERFVADPFSQHPGSRLYRTGDRARWRANGCIEFRGRADHQVKIRGFRVEPGEIAAHLQNVPGVREAAVIPQNASGDFRLIAYFTGGTAPSVEDIRTNLSKIVPYYMMPAAFVKLESLPLLPNGKLNRKALPLPANSDFVSRAFEEPIGDTEEKMAALWAELLKLERVGRNDNFFELGGHSLLAVALIERMNQMGFALDVRTLFTTPTIAGLAGGLRLSATKNDTPENLIPADAESITPDMLPLVGLSQQQIEAICASMPGGSRNIQDIYPLSPLQEGIFFQHLMTPEADPYLTPYLLGFDTHDRLRSFLDALDRVIARHDVLRTAVFWKGVDQPVQVVLRRVSVPLNETDSAALLAKFDPRAFPVDVAKAPPLRAIVAHDITRDRWLLMLVTHHLALDHISMEVITQELRTLMNDPEANFPPALPYRDFVAQTRSGTTREEHEAYFKNLLSDVEEQTSPFGLTEIQSGETQTVESRLSIDAQSSRRIREQSRQLGVTPATLFHVAWALALGQLCGKRDVVFGSLLLGRMQGVRGAGSTVGMFINTLPVRLKLDHGSVVECVHETHRQLADLLSHEHAPLALAQRASAVPPPTPLFSSLFNYRYSPKADSAIEWPGVEMLFAEERTNYPLAMAVDDLSEDFALTALAHPGADAARSCQYFETAISRLIDALELKPQKNIREIDALPNDERALVTHQWNQTQAEFPHGTLDALFREQARRTPDAIAVIGLNGESLTYDDLDSRSERFARALAANRVGLEDVVGVRMDRSAETIIALLGILKAGAVYLPLDPSYPEERLDYMVRDAGTVLVIRSLNELVGEAKPPTFNDPRRLAYIIYTSGTTGQPKGVAVAHTPAVNMAFARRACHDPIGLGDRIVAAISVGFDVSIGQLLLPLLSGATVLIAGDVKRMGASEFWSLLATRGVTHINSVPSFFDSILDVAPPADTLRLKRLMLGGEALSGALVSRFKRALPDIEVVNMYGPTEACIDATYHVTTPEDLQSAILPIGRPLSNYQAYILDERLDPVAIGVTGELYLGGSGLARGYVNAPDLTAEKFVADPFSSIPGARLYRTGDRAQWRADGRLEFMGRADQQVKIRGFRVEPEEIAAVLQKQPGVRDGVVVPATGEGVIRLIAYYTGDSVGDVATIRAAMAAVLLDYMVPAAFIKLDKLPLSSNGKLDRKALPTPSAEAFVSVAFEPPDGPVEENLAQLWTELLKVDRIGRHDNFFELGGHSLLVVTLIERMRQRGFTVDVRSLFTRPTIAGIAAELGSRVETAIAAPANLIPADCTAITPEMLPLARLTQEQIDAIATSVPGGARNIQDIYPLAPLQEGILFQHLMQPDGDPYLAAFLLSFDSRNRLDSFLQALDPLIQHHDVLRTAMTWKNLDEPLQVVWRHVSIPVEEADAAKLLAPFDPRNYGIDISHAPLLRAYVAHDAKASRWLLLLVTHHLILDHTSMEIMVRELRALMENRQAALPPAPPYRNFVAQTRLGPSREEHETFFKQLLQDFAEPSAPFGLLEIQAGDVETISGQLRLDPGLSRRIREQSRALQVSPASLFHVAWASVLGRFSSRRDVVFGTVLVGRMRSGPGADRAVGMFINTLPVRVKLNRTSAAGSVLQMHEQLKGLLEHEHASLSLAQRASDVRPSVPLFSSLFNFRYSPEIDGVEKWPGVEMLFSEERTNYPLSMAVDDSGSNFVLTALAHPGADGQQACSYLKCAIARLTSTLELNTQKPQTPVELDPMPHSERTLVIDEWNNTRDGFPRGTLDSLFVGQARRTPNTVAVIGLHGEELTYAELDAQSTRLARALVANGSGPGKVIGVRMERSAESIVALLGILKSGAAYLPLDPFYPEERLDYMVRDAGATLVLRSIDALKGEMDLRKHDDAGRLAYIIYTSGTTGQPKGVAVAHAPAVNMTFARRACHDPIGIGDRVLAAISIGFDVSIGQLLLPLLSGATVVIAGDVKRMGAAEFWSLIAQRGVTHINSVPSFFDSILDVAPPAGTLRLKRLMLGGEALSGALVGRIQRVLPAVEVVNMYGPTETCIDATYHTATPEDLKSAVLPIGRPLSNYQTYVLDDFLEPVGIGITGELYIGGAGLAQGYVNSPLLTAEKFIADPFSELPGARIYRTGDRARWRKDGRLEFLGRVDQQVKIRGFRVEPGEIAAALLEHPTVAQAVVVPRTDPNSGVSRLIAYVVPRAPDPSTLRAHLASRVPDYMVPAEFVTIGSIPLNANGKLDINALPAAGLHQNYSAPRTAAEEVVARLFAAALGREQCGTTDNFFELGGDSLGAIRLLNAVNAHFKIDLAVPSLFDNPTVAALASEALARTAQPVSSCLVKLQAGGQRPKLFCIHPAGGHVFCYLPLVRELGVDQPVYGLQAPGLEGNISQPKSIEETASRYLAEIERAEPQGPYHLLGMSSGGLIAFEIARQIKARGKEVRLLALLDTTVPRLDSTNTFTDEQMLRALAGEFGCEDLLSRSQPIHTLADLVEEAQRLERLPHGFGLEQAQRIGEVFRATARMHHAYRPNKWPRSMLLIRALRREEAGDSEPDWSPYVSGDLQIVDLDCGHSDLVSSALAPVIAPLLAKKLTGEDFKHAE